MSLKTVAMVTKVLFFYISVTEPDRPIFTIIDTTFYLASYTLTCGDPEGHNRSHNMLSMKKCI